MILQSHSSFLPYIAPEIPFILCTAVVTSLDVSQNISPPDCYAVFECTKWLLVLAPEMTASGVVVHV